AVVTGCVFFCQGEGGIRYWSVTGVQTCALPISEGIKPDDVIRRRRRPLGGLVGVVGDDADQLADDVVGLDALGLGVEVGDDAVQIGRGSCRERGGWGGGGGLWIESMWMTVV